jgi:ribonuclease D
MSREKRRRAKVLWYAREYYARCRDLPPEAVASKPQLAAIVERGLAAAEQIASFLNEGRKRYPVDARQLSQVLAEAERDSASDPRRG